LHRTEQVESRKERAVGRMRLVGSHMGPVETHTGAVGRRREVAESQVVSTARQAGGEVGPWDHHQGTRIHLASLGVVAVVELHMEDSPVQAGVRHRVSLE